MRGRVCASDNRLYAKPRPFGSRVAAFIVVEKIEYRLDWLSGQSVLNNKLLQASPGFSLQPGLGVDFKAGLTHSEVERRKCRQIQPTFLSDHLNFGEVDLC